MARWIDAAACCGRTIASREQAARTFHSGLRIESAQLVVRKGFTAGST
jgi:hypothetical protein